MIAITTGILSALWAWLATAWGLLAWAGFLGCTAYFACPQQHWHGLWLSLLSCFSGVFWAMLIFYGSALHPSLDMLTYALTGTVSFLMCVQAKQKWLSYIPGTFIGACATFASDGNWQVVLASLLLGLFFGFAMKHSGLWLANKFSRHRD